MLEMSKDGAGIFSSKAIKLVIQLAIFGLTVANYSSIIFSQRKWRTQTQTIENYVYAYLSMYILLYLYYYII